MSTVVKENIQYDPNVAVLWDKEKYLKSIPIEYIRKHFNIETAFSHLSFQDMYRNLGMDTLFFTNSKVFSPAAEAFNQSKKEVEGTGQEPQYCKYTKSDPRYLDWWTEERRRCKEGYTVGGVRITGEHYHYLNYTVIKVGDKKHGEKYDFPRFLAMDYYYFHVLEKAESGDQKHNLILAKSRRKGFSYKNAAGCVWRYNFSPGSTTVIGAEDNKKSATTFKMALDVIDFQNQYTEFGFPWLIRNKTFIQRGVETMVGGKKIVKGTKSIIQTITFKNNPGAAAGLGASRIIVEEAGTLSSLKEVYSFTEPVLREGDFWKGIMVIFGCVVKGTQLVKEDGSRVNVEDVEVGDKILSFGNKPVFNEVEFAFAPSKKPCVKLITTKNTELTCSKDHPILSSKVSSYYQFREYTKEGNRISVDRVKKVHWEYAGDLSIGDHVAVIDKIPEMFGTRKMKQPRLIGLLIGDGSYGYNKTPVLSTQDEETYRYLAKNNDTTVEKQRKTKENKTYREIRIKGLTQYLREIAIYGQTKQDKRLPVNLHTYTKESISELIGGFFDADGYVAKNKLVLTSAVKSLLEEVKHELLKFGVHSTIRKIKTYKRKKERKIKDVTPYYRLEINDKVSIKRFYRNISLSIKYKQEDLTKLVYGYASDTHLVRSAKIKKVKGKRKKEVIYLEGVRYERLRSIYEVQTQDVYNLKVSGDHTYIANNIITHNTGGDMDKATKDFADMMYNPKGYNGLVFDNIYDDPLDTRDSSGYFVPDLAFRNNAKVVVDGKTYHSVDENGNAIAWVADFSLNKERENKKKNKDYGTVITQSARNLREAFLQIEGNVFPAADLQEIRSNLLRKYGTRKPYTHGKLVDTANGYVRFVPDTTGTVHPIEHYPLKGNESTEQLRGSICIVEQPKTIDGGEIPDDAYIIGHDPWGIDAKLASVSATSSLGVCYVMRTRKYFKELGNANKIVAWYIGRTPVMDEYNENMLKLSKYYNAKVNFENDRGEVKPFFQKRMQLHRLCPPPGTILERNDISTNMRARKYGYSIAANKFKTIAIQYLLDWLQESRPDNPDLKNMHYIEDIGLLDEMISFSFEKGNYDRIMALIGCVLWQEDNFNKYELLNKTKEKESRVTFFFKKK